MLAAALTQLLTLAATVPGLGTDLSAAAAPTPEPIATRQTLFAIPFRIEPAKDASREPDEVHLWASGDRGQNWQLYSKVAPSRKHFLFRAGADGEYWFAVRTLDRSGKLWPKSADSPGLRVVVDTEMPKLQLRAQRGQGGQITASWQIDEPNAKPETLAIQYRTTTDGQWQSVAIDPQNVRTSGSTQTGQVTWYSQGGTANIQVRAEVSDTAGNLAVSHAQVGSATAAGADSQHMAQQPSDSWRAGTSTTAPPTQWPADRVSRTPISQAPQTDYTGRGYTGGDTASEPPSDASNATSSGYGGYNGGYGGYSADKTPTNTASNATSSGYGGYNSGYGGYSSDTTPTNTASEPWSAPVTSRANPPIADQYVPPGQRKIGPSGSESPLGQRPRMVNSRLFELEYDVDSVGPSGISRVELWGTRNGGRTWRSITLDNDNRSPLLVNVDEEGTYGFRVVVTSGAGLGGRPPQSGELPEVLITVDWTKPTARITRVEKGTGQESGQLIISWWANDTMLAARPISLSFSESPGGPWTTIATGLENTGRYAWRVDRRVPERIYIRLEVRDEAGNVTEFETSSSALLDRFRPAVRIRNVRPVGQPDPTSPKRLYVR